MPTTIPALALRWLEAPERSKFDLSSLRVLQVGGARLNPEPAARIAPTLNCTLQQVFGMAEGLLNYTRLDDPAEEITRTQGRPCSADDEIRIVDENDEDVPPGQPGNLLTRGPYTIRGYYKAPEHNKGLWIDAGDGMRWLNTGDLGREDEEGYFYLTGRKKELIIRGGHNIDPASIEEPLHEHPAVQIAAAVGRPDAHAGEVPVAYVQLKQRTCVTEADLMSFLMAHIGERAALPKAIRIIRAMPLTAVGKIFKPALKNREIEDALGDALRNAGVLIGSIDACSDPSYGTTVHVSVGGGSDAELARQVLGQFPFRFQLSDAALSRSL